MPPGFMPSGIILGGPPPPTPPPTPRVGGVATRRHHRIDGGNDRPIVGAATPTPPPTPPMPPPGGGAIIPPHHRRPGSSRAGCVTEVPALSSAVDDDTGAKSHFRRCVFLCACVSFFCAPSPQQRCLRLLRLLLPRAMMNTQNDTKRKSKRQRQKRGVSRLKERTIRFYGNEGAIFDPPPPARLGFNCVWKKFKKNKKQKIYSKLRVAD